LKDRRKMKTKEEECLKLLKDGPFDYINNCSRIYLPVKR